jgi:hypothetical protein
LRVAFLQQFGCFQSRSRIGARRAGIGHAPLSAVAAEEALAEKIHSACVRGYSFRNFRLLVTKKLIKHYIALNL